MKVCFICKENKSATEFYSSKNSKDGLHSYCKSCAKQKATENKRANPHRSREYTRKWRDPNYPGVSEAEYERMLELQQGVCAVCQIDNGSLQVDHCHTTGQFRGLLCNNCNSALGFLNDDIKLVENASGYLKEWRNKLWQQYLI